MTTPGVPAAPTVGELATAVEPVDAALPALHVDQWVREGHSVTSVVVVDRPGAGREPKGSPHLISVERLQRVLTGRRGYGRAIYAREGIGAIPAPATLVLDAAADVPSAARAMLGRPNESRYEDALVQWPDGRLGLLTVACVLEHLVNAYGHQALHDPLTGLANRSLLIDRLSHGLRRRRTDGSHLGLIFVDLDDFKGINDAYGHAAGDVVLVTLADRLRQAVRGGDMAARIGGDEFALLLDGLTSAEDAFEVGSRVLATLAEPVDVEGQRLVVSASLGVVTADPDADPVDLLKRADVAMYRAKGAGKGRLEVYATGMRAPVLDGLATRTDLARALATDEEIDALYQPIVDLVTGRVAAIEALARWWHPTLGLRPPQGFIPVAEESGLIVELGRRVLRRGCEALTALNADRADEYQVRLNVNLSGRQLQEMDIASSVAAVVADAGVAAGLITFEITESVFMQGEDAVSRLHALKHHGFRLALDDFGTGFSSLSYVGRLPVDYLKIDKSFVDGLAGPLEDPRLVRAIIGLGDVMGLEVVAEGIENAAQLDRLLEFGCRLGQGYHFARPLALEELVVLLEHEAVHS